MKTNIHTFKPADLIAELAKVAPSIAIETTWEKDTDARWDMDPSCGDPDDFTAWQSEVRASAIVNGQLVSGSAYLGGTWIKYGESPAKVNPEISGYLPQMIDEALQDLLVAGSFTEPEIAQINAALAII